PGGAESFWFELVNRGDAPAELGGLVLVSSGGQQQLLADRTIPPAGLAVVDQVELGFSVAAGERINLLNADRTHVLASAMVDTTLRGRSPDGEGPLFFPDAPTPGAPNTFQIHDEIVINEIMYQAAPLGGTETVPFRESDEEWIELFNRSDQSVNLTGWSLDVAVDYQFPNGTTIPPGGYLVVARGPEELSANYPSIADVVVGPFTRSLGDQTDQIVLVDAAGNRADEVTYFDNGKWPKAADGGGSSLELTDPLADNGSPLAWAASREGDASPWNTYTYQGVASPSSVGPDGQFNELVLGLLDRGEVLLDDIRVTQDPDGAAVELIQNGSFDADPSGGAADTWRIIGNHRHSEVVIDPDDPANQVLRLVATGASEHMHNHAETTLKEGDTFVPIVNGIEYRISFRAKWISGSNQLNTRLYFNRLARTTRIERPTLHGTPGALNSTRVTNIGPTIGQVQHEPAVPAADEPVTVTASATDPQGVAQLTLWVSVAGGPWLSVPMAEGDSGRFAAQLPGQAAATVVQFYVEGEDTSGARSTFPRAGADARALYQVDDGLAASGRHNIRIIMTVADADFQLNPIELMSNDRIGATVIYNQQQVFYDVGMRLANSAAGRLLDRLSFNIAFPSDQLFRGVHRTIRLDRSPGSGSFHSREILFHQGATHAGGLPTEYNDLVNIITPRLVHTGSAELQASRYGDVFLESQFERGGEGTLYKYEMIYSPSATTDDGTPEGRKLPYRDPGAVAGETSLRNLGADKEAYRWVFLKKNLRKADDFSRLIEFLSVMGEPGDAFLERIGEVIDVDQWLRGFAFSVITGQGDNYGGDGAAHNLQLYVRPSDQKVLFLPHDLDWGFEVDLPLVSNSDLRRLMAAPEYAHMYYGHVDDMLQTTFNKDYMDWWTRRLGKAVPEQESIFSAFYFRDIKARGDFLETAILTAVPAVPFELSTSSPIDVGVEDSVTVSGSGWVDVREIRLTDSDTPLPVEWTEVTDWQVTVPVDKTTEQLTLEAYDFQGRLIGERIVTVRSTAPVPVPNARR
ncbi:MAG: lamin tail domain-containing protein, partial [Pirellulales bacterium]